MRDYVSVSPQLRRIMNYEQELQETLELFPRLFANESELLCYLFFENGNGYSWVDGQLVDRDNRPFSAKLQESIEYDVNHRQSYADDCAQFPTLDHPSYEEVYCQPRVITEMYPICEYAGIANLPDDIQEDWLEAAKKAIVVAQSLERTIEDEEWLAWAELRIEQLEEDHYEDEWDYAYD